MTRKYEAHYPRSVQAEDSPSPTPKRSVGIRAASSKGILRNVISKFESWRPSQPLSPLWAVSALRIISRHFRRLARDQSVSAAGKSVCSGRFRNFCGRVSGREFLISGFCCLRLGSTALRPVRLRCKSGLVFTVRRSSPVLLALWR